MCWSVVYPFLDTVPANVCVRLGEWAVYKVALIKHCASLRVSSYMFICCCCGFALIVGMNGIFGVSAITMYCG